MNDDLSHLAGCRCPECDPSFNDPRNEEPWTVSSAVVKDGHGNPIATTKGVVGKATATQEANARLIAEAPAMLEALRDLMEGVGAVATIAKARPILARIDGGK